MSVSAHYHRRNTGLQHTPAHNSPQHIHTQHRKQHRHTHTNIYNTAAMQCCGAGRTWIPRSSRIRSASSTAVCSALFGGSIGGLDARG